jgi:hypothetical protein
VDSAVPPDTTLLVEVPVILSFLGPFPLKLTPQIVPADPANKNATSITASITNPLPVPLSVSGIYPTLMTTEPDLGRTTGATLLKPSDDKLSFAPSEQKTITMAMPGGAPLAAYTSLAVDFGPATPAFDPAVVLNHYQSLVATAGIHASAHFNCYLLKHPEQIPPSFANLVGMQLEVQHSDGVVVGVPLTRDNPSMDIAIPYTFAELLAGASLSQPTFRYRAKSIYPDHAGQFSDWIPQTGGIVEVTPV